MTNQAIRALNLLCYFLGKPQKASAAAENSHLRNIVEAEDPAAGIIEFEGGKNACFNATTAHFGYDAAVLGKECYGGGHPEIIAKFYEAISGCGDVPVTLESASLPLKILLTAYKSCGEKIKI